MDQEKRTQLENEALQIGQELKALLRKQSAKVELTLNRLAGRQEKYILKTKDNLYWEWKFLKSMFEPDTQVI